MEAHRLRFVSPLVFVLSVSALAHAESMLHFSIPPGDAIKTLQLFLTQSGVGMLYTSDDVQGVTTQAVSGDLTVEQALRQMLAGTDLEIKFEPDHAYVWISRKDKSAAPADPGPTGRNPSERDPADDSGRSREVHRFGASSSEELDEVVVTGTLLHNVLDVVSPLQVVRRADGETTAYATVEDMLQTLPLISRSGPNESYLSTGNFTRGVSANLRGLGAGATLVLVDGHRQAVSGNDGDFVDLSGIPWSAVDRIEVLADGASALYGSDAVAGVVNVIMRKDRSGRETIGRLGTTRDGASEQLVSQLSAWDWSSGHVLASYQYSERGKLAADARDYAASSDKRPFGGSDFRSVRASPGNVLDPVTLVPAYAIPAGGARSVSDLLAGTVNLQDRNEVLDLLPHRQTHSGFLSASQEVGTAQLFLEARVTSRQIHQRSFAVDQNLFVPASNPYAVNPFPGTPFTVVAYSFVDALGPIVLSATSLGTSATAGVRKLFGDTWHVELSGTHGSERAAFRAPNQTDPDRLFTALAGADAATRFNPFGANTAQAIAFIQAQRNDLTRSALSEATVIADGTLWQSEHAMAKLAVGATRRRESLSRTLPASGSFARSVSAGFAELGIPIAPRVSSLGSFPRFELSLAARAEHYSDFGGTTNPNISMKWAPSRALRIRTSWGKSFRAPLLVNVYDANFSAEGLAVFADPKSPTGQSPVLFRAGSNRDLSEETATTWTAGLDFAPEAVPVHASITYFNVDYRHRIIQPGAAFSLDILREESQWASVINRNPTPAQIDAICDSIYFRGNRTQCHATPVAAVIDLRYRNLLATYTSGFDASFDGTSETRIGPISVNARLAYMLNFKQRNSETVPATDVLDTVGNPLALKFRVGVDWHQYGRDLQGWSASAALEHGGAYSDGSDGSRVRAFDSFDAAVGYRTASGQGLLSDMTLELTAANLFNAPPPFVNREAGYDIANATPFGRVVALEATKRW